MFRHLNVGRVILAAALLCMVIATNTPARAQTQPYEIHVIVSLTGPAAFQGSALQKTLVAAEAIVNRQGGIKGQPIKFVFADDQSNPQVSVELMNQLVDKVPFVIGPGFTSTCAAAQPIVAKSGPVMWCTSSGLYPTPGSYAFAAGATIEDTALVLIRFMREKGWKRLALLATTDASGQAWQRAVTQALGRPENKAVELVTAERMNPADISAAGQWARIKAANPQAVLTLATGPAWGTMMRGFADAGLDVPVGGSNGNINITQLEQYKSFLPHYVYFPGTLPIVPNSIGKGPVHDAQAVFQRAIRQAGINSDLGSTIGWDPVMLLVDALRKLGTSVTPLALRDYIIKLHGWVGISGVYDFRDGQQRGLGPNSMLIDRWDSTKSEFRPVSRPGGYSPVQDTIISYEK